MAKQSQGQKDTVGRVMHEFKRGKLRSSSGDKVKQPRQAIAIALHEAGASKEESPAKNRAALRRTKRQERGAAGETRASLYAEERRRGIKGRSGMSKADLQKALR